MCIVLRCQVNGRDVTGLHGNGPLAAEAIQTLLATSGPIVVEVVRRQSEVTSSHNSTAPATTRMRAIVTSEAATGDKTENKNEQNGRDRIESAHLGADRCVYRPAGIDRQEPALVTG